MDKVRYWGVLAVCLLVHPLTGRAATDPLCEGAYRVAVDFLPQGLNPRRNRVNVEHFLNLQIYDPLVERTGDGLKSAFIDLKKSQPISTAFTDYTLCLLENVRFWDGSPITAKDLAKSIADFHQEGEPFAPLTAVRVTKGCVHVTFDRSDPDYFDKLTVVASTVIKAGSESERLPVGRGSYAPVAWTPTKMTLQHRDGAQADVDFARVELQIFDSVKSAVAAEVADVNMLNWDPKKLESVPGDRYRAVKAPRNRSYALIVSIPDMKVRKQFTGCFDRAGFLDAFGMTLDRAPGWIPTQMLGSDISFEHIQASMRPPACNFSPSQELPFFYQVDDPDKKIAEFVTRQTGHLPVRLQAQRFDRSRMIHIFTSHQPQVFLAGVDALSAHAGRFSEPAIFFDVFVDAVRFTHERLWATGKIANTAAGSITRESKQYYYLQAHQSLLQTGYVIPLGELPPTVFYPQCIKEVIFANPVTSYPKIDRVRKQP